MKFAKVLAHTAGDMPPEFAGMFLRYKELKKMLKNIPKPAKGDVSQVTPSGATLPMPSEEAGSSCSADTATVSGQLSNEELQFISALNYDLQRFNTYFMDKEEDAVIQMQALSDELAAVRTPQQGDAVRARIVDFHGEMVLLLHWSLLNYSACAKILKKHDKRSGVLLRAPYLANVLHQPFCATSTLHRLVKQAEQLVVRAGASPSPDHVSKPSPAHGAEPAAAAATTTAPCSSQQAGAPAAVAAQAPQHTASAAHTAPAAPADGVLPQGTAAASVQHAQQQDGTAPREQQQPQRERRGRGRRSPREEGSETDEEAAAASGDEQCCSQTSSGAGPRARHHARPILGDEAPMAKRTKAALETWAEMARTAITPSTVLLPEQQQAAAALMQQQQQQQH